MLKVEELVQKPWGARVSCDVCGTALGNMYRIRCVEKKTHSLTLCKKDIPKEWLKAVK